MLEAMNPRLQKITEWFDKNPATVALWRSRLTDMGRQAFEGLLTSGENFLTRLMRKFEDPGFQRLNWGGKIVVMMDEAAKVALPKAASVGAQIGVKFAAGIAQGVMEAAAKDPLVAAVIGAWVSSKVPGPITVKLAVGTGVALAPTAIEAGKSIIEGKKEERRYSGLGDATTWLDEKLRSTPPGSPLIPGGEIRARHATGGIFNNPHLGLVAEAGPEAIIPLSRFRSRAIDLWQKAGRYLGLSEKVNLQAQTIAAHATGGIFNNPHLGLVAEAGPEAIIPLDGSPRSKSLWERTGELIGAGRDGSSRATLWERTRELLGASRDGGRETIVMNNYFSPVIHGAGPEIIPELKKQQKSFIEQLEEAFHQKRRLSYT